MNMEDTVIVVRFGDESRAYQALSRLKDLAEAGDATVTSAVLVERASDGSYRIPEGADRAAGFGVAAGSLTGMLVGVLADPVGVLLGGSLGALVGSTADLARAADEDVAISGIAQAIEPGNTALVALVEEHEPQQIDETMESLGGIVTRHAAAAVYGEVVLAEEAAVDEGIEGFRARVKAEHVEHAAKWESFKSRLRDEDVSTSGVDVRSAP
jgi:uncharacterized membrane protein